MEGTLSRRSGLKRAMTPKIQNITLDSFKQTRLILTSTLESLDVLWSLSQLSNGLHEGDSRFLVSLEWGKDSS
jgi:hypothetical protein